MHSSQKIYETNEAILLCVCVSVFSFISLWNSSAFFHVIHIEECIKLKMKMSVWVRAVCIWNVHVHAMDMYWLCACLCAWEKMTKNRTKKQKRLDVTEMLLTGIWENDCVHGFCLCLLWKWLLRWHGWNNIETSFWTPFML